MPDKRIESKKRWLGRRSFEILMLGALALFFCIGVNAASGSDSNISGTAVRQLGNNLRRELTPQQIELIAPNPVVVETNTTPIIRLESRLEKDRRIGIVIISTGFIELIDQISCAEAIDIVKPDYLRKFLFTLDEQGRGFKHAAEDAILKSYGNEVQNEKVDIF